MDRRRKTHREKELARKIAKHLANAPDETMLLLKAHLLVEEHINHALEGILLNAQALDQARLTFFQKIQVLRAIDHLAYAQDALNGAERLNHLRNKLAHQLEPIGLDDGIASFVADVENWPETTIKKRDSRRLKFVRSIIQIGAQIDACRALYKILSDFTLGYTLVKEGEMAWRPSVSLSGTNLRRIEG